MRLSAPLSFVPLAASDMRGLQSDERLGQGD